MKKLKKPKLSKKQRRKIERIKRKKKYDEERILHKESQRYVHSLKVNYKIQNAVRDVVNVAISFLKTKWNDEIRAEFEKTLEDLGKEGKLFRSEYIGIKMDKFNIALLNKMGKRGWKFAFENDRTIFLTREVIFKEGDR